MKLFKLFLVNIYRLLQKLPNNDIIEVLKFDDCYVVLYPKVGSRTIRNAYMRYRNIRNVREVRLEYFFVRKIKLRELVGSSKTLIFVRDPYERLFSCWKQKVSSQRDNGLFYFWFLYPRIRPDMDFTTFLTTLSCLPLGLWEKHFKSVEMYLGKQNLEFVELVGVDKLDDFLGQYTKDTTKRANETKKIDSIFAKCRPIYHRRLKKFFNVEEVFFNGQ